MTNKTITLTDQLYEYILNNSLREPALLQELREETALDEMAQMQISPEQGQFMALLLKLMGACNTLEIGVYTGYSSLVTALALPKDGKVIACDTNKEWTQIAKRYWQKAGVSKKIDLRISPASQTLATLLAEGRSESFDFAFIDADKEAYSDYFEYCLQLIKPGGLICIDNVLWSGFVVDETSNDPDTQAIRAFNKHLHQDKRVEISMVPIADGLTLARKK